MPTAPEFIGPASRLAQAGKLAEAEAQLRRGVQLLPKSAEMNAALAEFLMQTGKVDQALFFAERVTQILPQNAAARNNLVIYLAKAGRTDQVEKHLREVVRLAPTAPQPRVALAHGMSQLGRHNEALAVVEEGRKLLPAEPEFAKLAAYLLVILGRADESIDVLLDIRAKKGMSLDVQQQLMMNLLYGSRLPTERITEEHRILGQLMSIALPADLRPFEGSLDPDRPLRIGYLSQDFRNRSAAHFIEPLVAHHDRDRYAVTLYSNTGMADEMTMRLQEAASGFVDVSRMDDRALAQRVRDDRIDIMVDLTGWTGGSRVSALALRVAPVQAMYLGYPCTTGLPAVQYHFVDETTNPPGSERLSTEELVRLAPCFLCYAPPRHAPEVAPGPSASGKPLTFGSFNTMQKACDGTFDAWAKVLLATPGSRLLLKNRALGDSGVRAWCLSKLTSRGVEASRVDLRGETPGVREHLATYAEVDIALDTFPYAGTTTTVEALWMGVPVVTILGNDHRSRVGASLLKVVGAPELVAAGVDEFVAIAAGLASDAPRRATLRSTLRQKVAASPLCDGPAFVSRLEAKYRELWKRSCETRKAAPQQPAAAPLPPGFMAQPAPFSGGGWTMS